MKVNTKTTGRAGLTVLLLFLLLPGEGRAEDEEPSLAKAEVTFTEGVHAFHAGKNMEAFELFQEAVGYYPGHGNAHHWLGLACLRLGHFDMAVQSLNASLSAELPPTAGRRRVKADLRIVEKALAEKATSGIPVEPPAYAPRIPIFEELPRWETRAGLEGIYDSNPGLLPEDLLFPLPGHPSLGAASSDSGARLDLTVEHHPFYSSDWSLGLALSGEQMAYQDQGDLDLSTVRGTATLSWGGDHLGVLSGPLGSTRVPSRQGRISFLLQGGGGRIGLGGDSYLRFSEGAFSLVARESRRTSTRLDLEARDSSYADDFTGALRRSGTEALVGASQYLFFRRERDRYLRLGFTAGERRAGRSFDSSSGEGFAEVVAPLTSRWTLSLLGSYREDRFDNPESGLGGSRPREDETWMLLAATSWQWREDLRWTLRASHVDRDSNVRVGLGSPLFDYERTTFSLGLEWFR